MSSGTTAPGPAAGSAYPLRRRAGGKRRDEVLDHVIAVIADRGYDRTRFTDVAKVSKVAVSTLQFHFGSHEDMLIEALHRSTEREVSAMEAVVGPDDPPWRTLTALVDRALDPEARVTGRMLLEFWHACARDPELRDVGAVLCDRYRQPFVAAIRAGIDRGDFTTDSDPVDLVTVLNGILEGLIIPRVLDHDYYDPPKVRAIVLRALAALLGVPPTT
ncbi:TetR/AcrR family transcriptional regulator [Actinokineospora auranticolor]|uniref:AcrR family transcriptional regulator n=1 Tax=Actinokineospora auranticolor TaxID=155976 RepID=A0A2S6GPD0_9PSEU|nr:TetR/AcrR family transcriptional regulator [Actinokineospora auranticolor]PPK67105.1 AcrR family transcriptional regulator [Actinokineospora auranticolor]